MLRTIFTKTGGMLLFLIILLTACTVPMPAIEQPLTSSDQETLFQTSTLSALLLGLYDGDLTISELKRHGDFGLGTFDALDGEMVVVDGEVYQVRSDGVAYLADDEGKTPFAVVTFFAPDDSFSLSETMTCAELQGHLDERLATINTPYAIKITGSFGAMKTRAPLEQSQPYPPLLDALANQAIFEFQDVNGSLVGFRLPGYMQDLNVVGYHFHFLTEDRQTGGHVLDCQVEEVEVEIDGSDAFQLDIPQNISFQQAELEQSEADQASAAPEPVVLGAIYSLSGSQSGLDVPSAQGAELAVAEANEAGGVLGRSVQLVVKDGMSEQGVVAGRAAEMIEQEPSVTAVFGLSDTDLVLAAAQVTAQNERLFLTSGATSPKLPEQVPDFLFLACFGDNVQAAAGAEWAYEDLSARTASILFNSESTYTQLLQGYFRTRFEALGGEVVAMEGYVPGDSASIEAAVALLPQADLSYLAATPEDALPAVKALREAGHTGPVLGGDGLDVAGLWEQEPEVDKVFFSTHAYLGADNEAPEVVAFREAYSKAYPDATPDAFAALGYDTARLLMTAVQQAGSSDPDAVRRALADIRQFEGVTGQMSFPAGSQIPVKSVAILGAGGGTVRLVKQLVPEQTPPP